MTLSRGAGLRLWVIANLAILLAVVVPGLLGYAYPGNVRHYVQWGGLALFLVSSLSQLVVAARLR